MRKRNQKTRLTQQELFKLQEAAYKWRSIKQTKED